MYQETTHEIQVTAHPSFVPEQSRVDQSYYFFAYRIEIKNQGKSPVQLLSRHWIITDGLGRTHEVKGDGVIGEQPVIEPGGTYEYTSFCPLETPTGNMRGSYLMSRPNASGGSDSEPFRIKVPLFFLRNLEALH